MIDYEALAKNIFNFIFNIAAWTFVFIAIIVMYFFFKPELLKQYAMILVPVFIYGCGMIISFWINNRKKKVIEKGGGSAEYNLYVSQFDFAKHDLLIFLVPLIIIGIFYWGKRGLSGTDLIASVAAFLGLYLTKLIYKRKIT